MGTSLCAITNSKLTGEKSDTNFDTVLEKFKRLNLPKSYSIVRGGKIKDDTEIIYSFPSSIQNYIPRQSTRPSFVSLQKSSISYLEAYFCRKSCLFSSPYWGCISDVKRRNCMKILP
jgi:hypothetical protein